MSDSQRAVFVISVAAELAGMHPQTLRIYERKGLIDPFRTPGGTRRYSQDDIERLQLIQEMTNQGMNLEGVRRVLDLQEENKRLRRKLDRLRERIEDLEEAMETQRRRPEIVLRSQVTRVYTGAYEPEDG